MKIKRSDIQHPHRNHPEDTTTKRGNWLSRVVRKLINRSSDVHQNGQHLKFLKSKGVVSTLGEGAFGSVRQGRYLHDFKAVKIPHLLIKEERESTLNFLKEKLNKFFLRGNFSKDEYLEAICSAEKIVEGYNSPEQERLIAEHCSSQYVIVPQMIDGYECAPMHGTDLGNLLISCTKDKKTLNKKLVISLFTQALLALKDVHEKGISHGDVKPENFLVNGVGQLKLTDFGLARHEPDSGELVRKDRFNEADRFLQPYTGSYNYQPPDGFIYKNPDRRAADAWAMGVLLIDMLLPINPILVEADGRMPLSVKEAIDWKITGRNKAISEIEKRNIDPAIIHLAKELLHEDPEKRMSISNASIYCSSKISKEN